MRKWFAEVTHRPYIPVYVYTTHNRPISYLITNDDDIIDLFPNYKTCGLIKARIIVSPTVSKGVALQMYQQEVATVIRERHLTL